MSKVWPVKCACGQRLRNKKSMNLHFEKLHVGYTPVYECQSCPFVTIAKRSLVSQHFRKHHAYDNWSTHLRILPKPTNHSSPYNIPFDDEDLCDEPCEDAEAMDIGESCHGEPLSNKINDEEEDDQLQWPPELDENDRTRLLGDIITGFTVDNLNQMVMSLLLKLSTECQMGPKGLDAVASFVAQIVQELSTSETFPVHQLKKLSTAANREKFMVEEMGLVLPEKVLLGHTPVTATSTKKRKQGIIESTVEMLLEGTDSNASHPSNEVQNLPRYGFIVPLRDSLSLLLKNVEIYNHIVHPEHKKIPTDEDDEEDHIITSEWQSTSDSFIDIFLGLSFDDAEITSPIKQAKTRHKMFIALYEVLNIPPRLRGKDVTKQLLYICKSSHRSDFKDADAKLLEDLIKLVQASAEGIQLTDDPNLKFRIHVVQITADNPAAASILKMKTSGNYTKQPCFRCWASLTDIKRTKDLGKRRRKRKTHEKFCQQLSQCETPLAHDILSTQTGILGRSPLFDIPGFDLSKVAVDPMHSMLESGILTTIVKYYLADLIQQGKVGKEQLQNKIKRWRYYNPDGERSSGTMDINVKEPWRSRISFGAISFLKMAKELPFIIQEYDQDSEKRHHFVKAMRLAVLTTYPPYFTSQGARSLRHLFLTVRDDFLQLYPGAWITPKWHTFLHIPQDIPRLGAPKSFSCLQSERKYHTIKQQGVRQCKNVAFTLANRAQMITLNQLFSWETDGRKSKTLEPEMKTKTMSEADVSKVPTELKRIVTQEELTSGLKQVKVGRFFFHKGSVVELSTLTDVNPQFGIIKHMSRTPKGISLVIIKSISAVYQPLFGWYEITYGEPERILLSHLEMQVTLTSTRMNSKFFVLREYSPILEYPL